MKRQEMVNIPAKVFNQISTGTQYRNPAHTVDAIIPAIPLKGREGIILVERKCDPFKGMLALPGGFVDYGETLEEAIVREVEEETGLRIRQMRQFKTYSDPNRDPRQHVISTVFIVKQWVGKLKAGDDAASIHSFYWKDNAFSAIKKAKNLAFDHQKILLDYLCSI